MAGTDTNSLRSLFTLDPTVTFLNHGSFGAMPLPVRAAQQAWRDRLERQPVLFLGREVLDELRAAMAVLATYVGAQAEDAVFVHNATFGVNVVARSLEAILQPGDEVLGTDHEYGACANAWHASCARTGARYVARPLPMPDDFGTGAGDAGAGDAGANSAGGRAGYVETFWAGVTPRTKVIFLSHITSPTAVQLPVEEIVQRARAAGILTVIDGAHAPGQLALDVAAVGADFYTGNCHKWLCAPKGAAFLHARPAVQQLLRPLAYSWGSEPHRNIQTGNDFQDALIWAGTDDPSMYLATAEAVRFQQQHDWAAVRAEAARRIEAWLPRLAATVGTLPVYAGAGAALRPPQMGVVAMPAGTDRARLKQFLYDAWKIEIPVTGHGARTFVRISVQAYNSDEDLSQLDAALAAWTALPT